MSFMATFLVPCVALHSHSRGQTPRGGVLELELEGVEKLDKSKESATTLRAECRHDKSVTAAYWDPRGRSIVSTSYDDTLRSTSQCSRTQPPFLPAHLIYSLYVVWDVSPSFMTKDAPFPHFKPLNRIRHNCQTVRIFFSVRTCPFEHSG
jgi:hypothetical protein